MSLDDLGFGSEKRGDPALQSLLDRRSRMLRYHQLLGLATAVPMVAALLTADEDAGEEGGSGSKLGLHAALGATTGVLYMTTASFALRAPRVPGMQRSGSTRIHRALAFVHVPAMVLTPILGFKAKRQVDRGEEIHGIAKYHQAAALTLVTTYVASMTILVFNF